MIQYTVYTVKCLQYSSDQYAARMRAKVVLFVTHIHIHTEKCLVGFTIKWLIQLHDFVSCKATKYLAVVTISDSCNDLGNTTI